MLENDKKVVKKFIFWVWGIVIFVPLLLVLVNVFQYYTFKKEIDTGKLTYFNTLNQVYSSEVISLIELDSIKKQLVNDTTLVFDNRIKNRFDNIEKSVKRHNFIVDSLNNNNLLLFEGKMNSLNSSIEIFNKKVSKMNDVKTTFELKSNIFYSLVMLIIALTAFLGYRSIINLKTKVNDDAIDEANKTAKKTSIELFTDEVKSVVMNIVREDKVIYENWANFEKDMEEKLEEFKTSIESDMDSSDSAKISILEEQVFELRKKVDKFKSDI